MSWSQFWNRSRTYRKEILLQQLEERIVLDAAVGAAQDNPNDHVDSHTNPAQGAASALPSDSTHVAAPDAAGSAGGNAGLTPQLPQNFDQAFHHDLNVVLVANNLTDVKAISDAATHDAKVIVYDAANDNLATVTSMLQDVVNSEGHKIDNLAIVGHGSDGVLSIGADQIQFFALANYKATFEVLGQTLSQNAQVQLYACSLAANTLGHAMVDNIATYTAANVYASTDTTGGAGHDWDLEYSSESSVAPHQLFNSDALASLSTALTNPVLVKDVDQTGSSAPSGFKLMNGKVFFSANDGAHGTELWAYDPAAGTTSLVADINPGTGAGTPTNLTVYNDGVHGDILYFSASDGASGSAHGTELWATDGTTTQMVADLNSGTASSSPSSLTVFNGKLYFNANDGGHGTELWALDATSLTRVTDINSAGSSNPANLTVYNDGVHGDVLYFSATDGTTTGLHGVELWSYDGATASRVTDINSGTASSSPAGLTVFNDGVHGDVLYFSATDGTGTGMHGNELWSYDGSTVARVTDINAGTANSSPTNLTVFNGKLYFSATDAAHGKELWAYDGTTAPTQPVADINSGTGNSNPASLTVFNGKLYFSATDGTVAGTGHGIELWATDGATTSRVTDINASTASSSPANLTVYNGQLYFSATDGTTTGLHGVELWATDGTTTAMVKDINGGTSSSSPTGVANLGGMLYFAAADAAHGNELWKSDGTEAGTVLVQDLNLTNTGSGAWYMTNVNGTVFFVDNDGVHGAELWKTDGTEAGTVMVKDIYPGSTASNPTAFASANGSLFFEANDGINGIELWKSDGTEAGTVMVKDISAGAGSSSPVALTNINGTIYFQASDAGIAQPWKSDGTADGTVKISSSIYYTNYFTDVNGTVFFSAYTSALGYELYKIDAGGNAVLVKDIYAGTGSSSSPTNLTNLNGTLYFIASDGTGVSLWKSDGTEAGTAKITGAVGAFAQLTNCNGTLFFQGYSGTTGYELWKVDPSGNSYSIVKDIWSGVNSGGATNLRNVNGVLYFTANDGINSAELWKSDGTSAGTVMVKDIWPGGDPNGSLPNYFTYVNGTIYFAANDGTHGVELWQTDGTAAGTVLVMDINPGSAASSPNYLVNANNSLFFAATTAANGVELWTISGNAAPTATNMTQGHTVAEDSGALNLTDIVVTDPDTGDTITATLTVNNTASGVLSSNDGATYDAITGLWTVSGAVADVNTALANVTFTPDVDWNGTVNLTTHVQDAAATGPSDGLITVDVTPVNDPPTATNMTHTDNLVQDGGAQNLADIVVTDPDAGDTITATLTVNNTASGVLSANDGATYNAVTGLWTVSNTLANVNTALANVTFTPNADWNGTVDIVTHVQDAVVTGPANGAITVNVTAVNDAPIVGDVTWTLAEDNTFVVTTMGTFNDLKDQVVGGSTVNNPVHGTIVDLPANGTLLDNGVALTAGAIIPVADVIAGNLTFQPDANWNGSTSFHFTVTDDGGIANGGQDTSLLATANVTVTPVNDPPTATNMTQIHTVLEDSGALNLTDIVVTDPDAGDVITATLTVNNTASGVLSANDGATYNAVTGLWTVSNTLANVNTALANVTFTPNADWNGTVDITTHVQDAVVTGPANGAITVNVTAVNDAPIVGDVTWTLAEDNTFVVTTMGTFNDLKDQVVGGSTVNNPVHGTIVDLPANGTLLDNGVALTAGAIIPVADVIAGNLTFQPDANWNGSTSFHFTVTDDGGIANGGQDTSLLATANVTVTPVNDPPTATNMTQIHTVLEDSGALSLTDIVVTDPDAGDTITATLTVNNTASGVLSANDGATYNAATGVWTISNTLANVNTALANVTFTPGADWNGTVNITTHVQDAAATGPADGHISVDVTPVNDAPVNTVPLSVTADEDVLTPVTGISISDVDAGASVVHVTLSVAHGTLLVNDAVIGGLTAAEITGNASGSVLLNGTLAEINATLATATGLQYQSVLNYNGADTLTVFTDDLGATGSPGPATATDPVAITVNPVNDLPVAVADAYGVDEGGVLNVAAAAGVLANDSDVDGPSALSAILATGPTHGDLTFNADGSFTYTPFTNFSGVDSFTYKANDGLADSNTVGVDISVNAVNHAPANTVPAVSQQSLADGSVTFSAANGNLISVSDVDAGTGLLKVTVTATHGTLTLSGVAGLTFDPGQGDGTADTTMTFQGTLADINAALDGMKFNHAAGYYGMADVTVTTNDQGNTGAGGPLSATNAASVSVEQYNVWFHGFGPDAGWDTYNYNGGEYYTHDYKLGWQHVASTNAWNFYNTQAWVATDARGDAPYADGFGPVNTWFNDTVVGGTYNGYQLYITPGVTYFSLDHTAAGATYWSETLAGAWSYYDASKWMPTAGFNVEPVNVWFHGYGADLGWDTYNYNGGEYYTQDYKLGWQHVASTNAWNFYNTQAWVATDARGDAPYADGFGPINTWFNDTVVGGTYNGYQLYITTGVTYFSLDHTAAGATSWSETLAGAWSYYDASKWMPTAGFNVEPMNVWFHGYGADLGWDTYNYNGGEYFTHDYHAFWQFVNSSSSWNYYNGTSWNPVSGLGSTV